MLLLLTFHNFLSPVSGLQSLYTPEDYLLYDHFQKFLFLKFSLSPIIQAFWSTSTIHSFSHVPWLSAVVFSITSSPFTAWPQECFTWNALLSIVPFPIHLLSNVPRETLPAICFSIIIYSVLYPPLLYSLLHSKHPLTAQYFKPGVYLFRFNLSFPSLCQKSHGSKGIKKGYPFFGKTIYCLLVLFTLLSKFRFFSSKYHSSGFFAKYITYVSKNITFPPASFTTHLRPS